VLSLQLRENQSTPGIGINPRVAFPTQRAWDRRSFIWAVFVAPGSPPAPRRGVL